MSETQTEYTLEQLKQMAVDAMNDSELKEEVEAAAAADAAEAEPESEPADEPSGEPDRVIYRRTIDLGDGSGVQVFEADTAEDLIDKLAKAQENATRKIRELNRVTKSQPEPYKPRELSEDEEFVLSQEFMTKPSAAFQKIFKDVVGLPIEEFRTKMERVAAFEQAQAADQASTAFIEAHPEYVANPQNGQRLVKYLETYKLPTTPENLDRAYRDLSASGLVEVKAAQSEEQQPRTSTGQFAPKPPVKKSSGLSTRRTAPAPKPNGAHDPSTLSLDQLKELAEAEIQKSWQ
jgi:hypothetical protein